MNWIKVEGGKCWHWIGANASVNLACGMHIEGCVVQERVDYVHATLRGEICPLCLRKFKFHHDSIIAEMSSDIDLTNINPDKYTEPINWMCENKERFESVSAALKAVAEFGTTTKEAIDTIDRLRRLEEKQDAAILTKIRTDSHIICHSCGHMTRSSLHLQFSDGESELTAIVCPFCISTMNQKLMLAMAGHIEGEA